MKVNEPVGLCAVITGRLVSFCSHSKTCGQGRSRISATTRLPPYGSILSASVGGIGLVAVGAGASLLGGTSNVDGSWARTIPRLRASATPNHHLRRRICFMEIMIDSLAGTPREFDTLRTRGPARANAAVTRELHPAAQRHTERGTPYFRNYRLPS